MDEFEVKGAAASGLGQRGTSCNENGSGLIYFFASSAFTSTATGNGSLSLRSPKRFRCFTRTTLDPFLPSSVSHHLVSASTVFVSTVVAILTETSLHVGVFHCTFPS